MKELDIKIGYNCNNNCLFCLNKDKRWFNHNLLNLKNQIKKSAEAGCKKIIISGGEPLIYNSFFEILNFAKFHGIRFCEIQTNGRMLFYDSVVQKIKSIFSDASFLVSFHYPSEEMYEKYSRSNGFYQVLKGIENLNSYKLEVTTNTVIFKDNYMELPKIVDILDEHGCNNIQFRFIDGKNVFDNFHDFVPKMKESICQISSIIEKYPNKKIYIHEIPFCILGEKLSKHVTPPANSERDNFTADNQTFTSCELIDQQFVFPNCSECVHRKECKGVRKHYFDIFGGDEFNPIKK